MEISLELVPNSEEQLIEELSLVKDYYKEINAINIPELIRFSIRSWEGCAIAKAYFDRAIPHIRAIDLDLSKPLPMKDILVNNKIKEVLVLAGDPPADKNRVIYNTTTIDIVKKFKQELPDIKVYCAIDQYRDSIKNEIEYTNRKLEAGADAFFTQPFFDLRLLELYEEMLENTNTFFGLSPVLSNSSMNYWNEKNNVIFPKGFAPNLEWNAEFTKKALDFLKNKNKKAYLMPIQTDLKKYLDSIFK